MPEAQAEAVVDLLKEAHEQQVTREALRYELALIEERLGKRIDLLDKELTCGWAVCSPPPSFQ